MFVLLGIIFTLFIILVIGSWLNNRFGKRMKENQEEASKVEIPLDCCGAHEVCEFEEMLKHPEEIIYFEDEELDRFKGLRDDQYNDRQIEEFREVLYSLRYEEIRKWLLSIERRQIQLPGILKQEVVELILSNKPAVSHPV